MVIVRSRDGIPVEFGAADPARLSRGSGAGGPGGPPRRLNALFFLVSPEEQPGQHLRLLGHLATHVDDPAFMDNWLAAEDAHALKETLLREERSLSLRLSSETPARDWIGRQLLEIRLPGDVLVALIRRGGHTIVPHGRTVLEEDDLLTVIGEPGAIRTLARQFRPPPPEAAP